MWEYIVLDYYGPAHPAGASEWLTRKGTELQAELIQFEFNNMNAYAVYRKPRD